MPVLDYTRPCLSKTTTKQTKALWEQTPLVSFIPVTLPVTVILYRTAGLSIPGYIQFISASTLCPEHSSHLPVSPFQTMTSNALYFTLKQIISL